MNSTNTDFNLAFKPEAFTLSPSERSLSAAEKSIFIITDNHAYASFFEKTKRYSPTLFKSFREVPPLLKATPSHQLPEAIVGYYDDKNKEDIKNLGKTLIQNESLSKIPFILIKGKHCELTEPQKGIPGADALVHHSITLEGLQNEIKLIKKWKKANLGIKEGAFFKKNAKERLQKNKISYFFKRVLDLIISILLLCLAGPLMLIIALVIKLESKGPALYAAKRSGTDYRVFKFYKFRSMYQDADQKLHTLSSLNQYSPTQKNNPVFFKISDDPRITKSGRILRNTSLDELPQLFNVIKGDMSIVGNRPLPLYEAKTLTTDNYAERFNAPSGITGLWQVTKRGKKEMSAEERIKLDIHYARHHSLLYDMKIIMKTPAALTQKDDV